MWAVGLRLTWAPLQTHRQALHTRKDPAYHGDIGGSPMGTIRTGHDDTRRLS